MSSERVEWVEIIEPRTKERMYANLANGECVWDPPQGVNIKRTDDSQWWELFDSNTSRFYYYNVATQKTVWHRPQNCDIIPLAKLQTLKQNTDPNDTAKQSTLGKLGNCSFQKGGIGDPRTAGSAGHSRIHSAGSHDKRSSELLASPQGRNSLQFRHGQGGSSRNSQKYIDSGKSSDSSLSSATGYRRLQEGGSLRIGSSQQNKKYGADNYYALQESSSSHNIPHIALPVEKLSSQQMLSYSISNSSDLGSAGISPSHSVSTPQLKKKSTNPNITPVTADVNSSNCSINNKHANLTSKHQSFDYSNAKGASVAAISLTRSGSFMSSAGITTASTAATGSRHKQAQRKGSFDGNNCGSDDSMHEKYFKSVENTPVSRRRHTTTAKSPTLKQKNSSDSQSPQSPISPQNQGTTGTSNTGSTATAKSIRPSALAISSTTANINNSYKSSHKSDPELINLDITVKPERYLDKMKMDKGSISPGVMVMGSGKSSIKSSNSIIKSSSSQNPSETNMQKFSNINWDPYLSKPNLDRHNKELKQTLEKKSTVEQSNVKTKSKKPINPPPEVEYDNGNISPLYSNWDQEMQEHLLPLQHYILEQAKLSGCYGLSGETLDSDSYHSDSQSEHSLSGHEPDNEDSDHSDGRGDYLSHYPYDKYGTDNKGGVSYYNFELNFDKAYEKEDISDDVEAKLESYHQDQIYSPVKNHPPLHKMSLATSPIQHLQPNKSMGLPQQFQQRLFSKNALQQPQLNSQFQPPRLPPHNMHTQQHQPNLQQQQQKSNKSNLLQRFQESLASNIASNDKIAELAILKECDIEKFAHDNLNLHSKGIFRKKSSIRDMLSWTSDAISRPMLSLARDKAGKKMATELFKLVQIYMGDRKARQGMSINSVAIDIISMAVANSQLRDEMYIQLCRQTTENPMRESLIRGWELLAICLSFIPPSPTFQPALLGYMNRHRDPTFATSFPEVGKWPIHVQISHYATIACRRLDRIGSAGKKQAKKPTEDEINQTREQIFRDSMFGNTLQEVMDLQKDRFPERKLPWIQATLSEQVLLLSGKLTEGIFRVSADVDEVNLLKSRLDRWDFPENKGSMDAHAPASLLKLWYRELYDPLIPDELYDECVQTDDPKEAALIINKLPHINRLVLTYLVHFLQQFSLQDVVLNTKMDSSNLAMVFAPNCLRCTSQDPKVILENARKEMAFMRTLILHMDTTSVANIV